MGPDRPMKIAVQMDDMEPQTISFIPDYAPGTLPSTWQGNDGYISNAAIDVNTTWPAAPGAHTLKVWMVEPSVIVQKVVIGARIHSMSRIFVADFVSSQILEAFVQVTLGRRRVSDCRVNVYMTCISFPKNIFLRGFAIEAEKYDLLAYFRSSGLCLNLRKKMCYAVRKPPVHDAYQRSRLLNLLALDFVLWVQIKIVDCAKLCDTMQMNFDMKLLS